MRSVSLALRLAVFAASSLALLAACSSSSSSDAGASGAHDSGIRYICQTPPVEIADAAALVSANASAPACATPGGAATGPADTHCGGGDAGADIRQSTDVASCCTATAPAGDDGGGGGEVCNAAGTSVGPDDGTCCGTGYGPSMDGQEGSDDDCKYDIAWTSTPICEHANVYFTVKVNKRVGATAFGSGPALTGAAPRAEVVLNCDHPVAGGTPPVESVPGVYQVGPIVFDQPGKWNVRFHVDENCDDVVPTSPHGHAAFWVNVP